MIQFDIRNRIPSSVLPFWIAWSFKFKFSWSLVTGQPQRKCHHAHFFKNLYSSVDLLRGQAVGESMTIHESMMVVMVIRDEDDDHPS